MTYTSAVLNAPRVNAILSPAGAHAGRSSTVEPLLVRFVFPEPSAFIFQISSFEPSPAW
jgi:hypothetical protein